MRVRWRPFQLRIKGKGQRSVYSEYKVKYSYLDARRWANLRPGGLVIKGPLKIYDTTPALVGGLFADKQGRLVEYSRIVFDKFFRRELEVDQADAVAAVIAGMGLSEQAYRDYLAGDGMQDYEAAHEEATADQIFGVPIFVFNERAVLGPRPHRPAGAAPDETRAWRATSNGRRRAAGCTMSPSCPC